MSLPAPVQAVVDAYLEITRAEAGTLVEGLYLVGSVALDDFQPHASDIDFIAVAARRPQPAELAALERVHTRLRTQLPRPFFDGIYVTWADLARDPAELGPGPSVHEGSFHPHNWGERTPIAWHTLAQQGVGCHGRECSGDAVKCAPAQWRSLARSGRSARPLPNHRTSPAWGAAARSPGLPKSAQRLSGVNCTQRTPAGLPWGIPGIGDEIDGAIQQAAQPTRHSISYFPTAGGR